MGFKESLKNFVLGAGILAAGAGAAEAKPSQHASDLDLNKAGVENHESPQDRFIDSVIVQATHGFDVKDPALLQKAKDIMKKNLTEEDLAAGEFAISAFADSLHKKLLQKGAIVEHVKPGTLTADQMKKVIDSAPQLDGEPDLESAHLDGNILVGNGFIAVEIKNTVSNLARSIGTSQLISYGQKHNLETGLNPGIIHKDGKSYRYIATK